MYVLPCIENLVTKKESTLISKEKFHVYNIIINHILIFCALNSVAVFKFWFFYTLKSKISVKNRLPEVFFNNSQLRLLLTNKFLKLMKELKSETESV
jgi:hypothetical protein